MSIEMIEKFIINVGGKQKSRLPMWNVVDDSPTLNHVAYVVETEQGRATFSCFERKEGIQAPDYACDTRDLHNKFSVIFLAKEERDITKAISLTNGNIEINLENLNLVSNQLGFYPQI